MDVTNKTLLEISKTSTYKYNKETQTKFIKTKAWAKNPYYFSKVTLSTKAKFQMFRHTVEGGKIEVMGILIGKINNETIEVLDVVKLPVLGTETRVNAQSEAYEFMVSYMTRKKQILNENINCVGWYHSHPDYGCFLSGIDVQTQELNQRYQDPFIAIVVDPIKSIKTKELVIGAYRTLPSGFENEKTKERLCLKETGAHNHRYYELKIQNNKTKLDEIILKYIKEKNRMADITSYTNKAAHISNRLKQINSDFKQNKTTPEQINNAITKLCHINRANSLADTTLKYLFNK